MREIHQKQQQSHPQHVGNDRVHAHVPAQQGDAVGQAVGGRDHLSREQKQHHCFQVEPDAVEHARPDLLEDDAIGDGEIARAQRESLDDLLARHALAEVEGVQNDGRRRRRSRSA